MNIQPEKIKACPLFRGLAAEELPGLLERLEAAVRTYKKNETVFWEGGRADCVGIILSGGVHIVQEGYGGNRSVIALMQAPELFGVACAFADIQRLPAGVAAACDSEIMLVPARKMLSVLADEPRILQNLLRVMAQKNLLLKEKIEFLSIRTTKEKLMAYLSAQARAQGSRSFTIPYDRQGLADYLGVERSAMSAELGKLRAAGKIDFRRNRFELL